MTKDRVKGYILNLSKIIKYFDIRVYFVRIAKFIGTQWDKAVFLIFISKKKLSETIVTFEGIFSINLFAIPFKIWFYEIQPQWAKVWKTCVDSLDFLIKKIWDIELFITWMIKSHQSAQIIRNIMIINKINILELQILTVDFFWNLIGAK